MKLGHHRVRLISQFRNFQISRPQPIEIKLVNNARYKTQIIKQRALSSTTFF